MPGGLGVRADERVDLGLARAGGGALGELVTQRRGAEDAQGEPDALGERPQVLAARVRQGAGVDRGPLERVGGAQLDGAAAARLEDDRGDGDAMLSNSRNLAASGSNGGAGRSGRRSRTAMTTWAISAAPAPISSRSAAGSLLSR